MNKIRGKTLKEWKEYCKSDNVPIKTMKYITCLEERIEALTIPILVKSVNDNYTPHTKTKEFNKDLGDFLSNQCQ
tara:strand:+ start:63 stop:287 length:225 start_codon:yes stop_codon:yes gene_type:complete